MSHLKFVALAAALCCACTSSERRSAAPSEPTLAAPSGDFASFAAAVNGTEPSGDPPPAWINNPAELGPEFPQSASNCDFVEFPFPAAVQPYLHPYAACRERAWGGSGIHRQQGRGLH